MTKEEFEESAALFFSQIQTDMKSNKIILEPHWSIDHVCYRVETKSRYEELKRAYSNFCTLLVESPVGGRMISTFKLLTPLFFGERMIDLVELPEPKIGSDYREGFEHIEIVCDLTFDQIKRQYKKHGVHFKKSGQDKDFNSELAMSLGGYAIKFHHLSLASVVAFEINQKVFNATRNLMILSHLKEFRPLVAGSVPLGISVGSSDLDILVVSDDLMLISKKLESLYGGCDDFKVFQINKGNIESVVASFVYEGVMFEVFAQSVESVQQRAYLHFQTEERLLKIGGDKFLEKIADLRKSGLKTEPAFGHALKLKEDPYLKLLDMHRWSDRMIIEKLSACGYVR